MAGTGRRQKAEGLLDIEGALASILSKWGAPAGVVQS